MTSLALRLPLVFSLIAAAGCARGGFSDAGTSDAGVVARDASGSTDGGVRDAGPPRDAARIDAGLDAGAETDAGPGIDGGSIVCLPNPSNMIINEVMVRSEAGSDDLGEWFEVHNRTACTIDLTGLVITSPTGGGVNINHTVTAGFLTAGGFFVFAQSPLEAENHALDFDYAYGDGTAGVVLNNGSDSLILSYGGTEIDRVEWNFMPPEKISRQLDRDSTGADNRDLGSPVYCNSTRIYSTSSGGPYLGTPGMANDPC